MVRPRKRVILSARKGMAQYRAFLKREDRNTKKHDKRRYLRAVEIMAEEERAMKRGETLAQVPVLENDFFIEDDGIDYNSPIYTHTITRGTWERYTTEELVNMYVESLAKGKPSLALTDPQEDFHDCKCTDKRAKSVTLYMMCAHVERVINYCSCTPLVKALFGMQFLASGGKVPNVAIHFAMLNYLHVTKMIEQTSTHGFTEIANTVNEGDKPLQKDVLNSVYLLYRRIVNHATDLMNAIHELKQ